MLTSQRSAGVYHTGAKQQFKGQDNAVWIFGAIIVAGDRLRPLCEALERKHSKLHDTGKNGHCADSNIASVLQKARN